MTDLSEFTADQLAEKVRLAIPDTRRALGDMTEFQFKATHEQTVEGSEALDELVRRASERDQAVRERDEARVAFLENPLWIQQVAETRRLRDALKEIEVIRMAAAGPNKPLPHSARVEIGQIARSALAAGGGKAAT